jgi:hypothetical protein
MWELLVMVVVGMCGVRREWVYGSASFSRFLAFSSFSSSRSSSSA